MRATANGGIVGDSGESLRVSFAKIACASSGDNTLVAAVASKKIRVISLFMVANNDVVAYFVDGNDTAIAGDGSNGIDLTANSGFSLNFNPGGWFETGSGYSLDVNLDGAVTVAGSLSYVTV